MMDGTTMVHSVKQTTVRAHHSSGLACIQQAAQRARSERGLLEMRRERLGERLRKIATAGHCTAGGQRYVLAQAVGSAERPLWVYLCAVVEQPGQLVFCGNRKPIEFSESDALALAPLLTAFMGAVEFQPKDLLMG